MGKGTNTTEYTIRGIDRNLWTRFKADSVLKGISIKDALVQMIHERLGEAKPVRKPRKV